MILRLRNYSNPKTSKILLINGVSYGIGIGKLNSAKVLTAQLCAHNDGRLAHRNQERQHGSTAG